MKQKSLFWAFLTFLSCALIFMAGCGKGTEKVRNENIAAPGRDKELYEQASEKLRKGRYDESRLLYNVIVSTYPDSEYLSLSKLAIADSFYLEGGTSNLEQAVAQYRDFVQYFPTHPKVCDVYLKMAESYMRQMGAYNRDMSKADQAYRQLKAAQSKCGSSELKAQVDADLKQVEQIKAMHEIDVAETYIKRLAWKSVELRTTEVIDKYPNSNLLDMALFYKGIALIEQEQPEEASQYFARVVQNIPNSEFAKDSKQYLEKLGKPIPAAANNDPAPPRPSRYERAKLIFGMNNLQIRNSGVMVNPKGKIEPPAAAQTTPQGTSGDIQSYRSAPRPTTAEATKADATPADATKPAESTPAASGTDTNAQPATKTDAKVETKPADPKAKETKKKKGLFGIFK